MSTNEIPKWIRVWGSIVGAITATLIMLLQFTNLFKNEKPPQPAPINVILPDNEPLIMPVLRHIEDGVYRMHKKMGIQDTLDVGRIDSTLLDSIDVNNVGGSFQ